MYGNICKVLFLDESIEQCEYHEYQPITGASHNKNGEITINIESKTCSRFLVRAT